MPEAASPKSPDKSRRAVILATVGIVVIMSLAVFYVAVVAPLRETHKVVRISAGSVLVEGASSFGEEPVRDAIARLGGPDRAMERLLTYRHLPDWMKPDRNGATLLLGWCGPRAMPMLFDALKDNDKNIRYCAILALEQAGPEAKKAVPALVKVLGTQDNRVRYAAARALDRLGPETVTVLVEALFNEDAHLRDGAAMALFLCDPEKGEIETALRRLLKHEDANIRDAARKMLEETRAGEIETALSRLLKHEDASIRDAARKMLEEARAEEPAGRPE